MVTKSGTNQMHGSLYEFLRNSALGSNNFFANAAGRPLGSFKRNEFGATFGGPIYLPKLYDGRNRSFFFVAYERNDGDSSNSSARLAGSSAGSASSTKSIPAILHKSQPRNDHEP